MYVPQRELDCWGPDIVTKDQVVTENGIWRASFKDEMNSCLGAIDYNIDTHIQTPNIWSPVLERHPISQDYNMPVKKTNAPWSMLHKMFFVEMNMLMLFYKVLQLFLF